MNILIPDSWLREHLQTTASKTDIQKYLSLSGPSVERIYHDDVYDLEVTTNRVDCMSVRGIAREAATILKRAGFAAKLKAINFPEIKKHPHKNLPLPEIIYETEAVHRVLAVVMTNVQHVDSPELMKQRLQTIDVNVHEALIDISNYVTHELGHPCHVFDYDKIMNLGGKIIIKEANKGKSFVTLDGATHQTLGGEIVFEAENGEIIDLPAIKGTLNTGVDQHTKSILFWIESLDAQKVRYASMSHAIRTVAAQLNEKNVDPHLAKAVMMYGVQLFSQLCQAQVASELYDYFPAPKLALPVQVKYQSIENYLGIKLPKEEIQTILTDLDCQVISKNDGILVTPPTFRSDLQIPADVIEELARIYGYHNLPSKLMSGELAVNPDPTTDYHLENLIKHFLATRGWQEIYSYSLVSAEQAVSSGYDLEQHLKLANPLTQEHQYLRRSLIPSLCEILAQNPTRQQLAVFEIAKLYHPQTSGLPEQNLTLTLVAKQNYRQVKGDFLSLCERLFIFNHQQKLLIKEKPARKLTLPQAKQEAELIIVKQDRSRQFIGHLVILDQDLVALEIDLASLLAVAKKYPRYQKIIKTATINESLTFTLQNTVAVGTFMDALSQLDPRIKKIELSDIYHNNFTFNFLFQDPTTNLSNETVEPIRQKIVRMAENEFQAQLVGQI